MMGSLEHGEQGRLADLLPCQLLDLGLEFGPSFSGYKRVQERFVRMCWIIEIKELALASIDFLFSLTFGLDTLRVGIGVVDVGVDDGVRARVDAGVVLVVWKWGTGSRAPDRHAA